MLKKILKKLVLSPWTALITLAIILSIRIADPAFVESVRLRYFDTIITAPRDNAPTNVVTVNIDEATLERYGQWPFARDKYAEIIDGLYARNAGLVVFNVLMPEPDRFGKDDVLATVLRTQENVVLSSTPSQKTKNKPRNPGSAVLNPEYMDQILQYPGLIANVPKLERSEERRVGKEG